MWYENDLTYNIVSLKMTTIIVISSNIWQKRAYIKVQWEEDGRFQNLT